MTTIHRILLNDSERLNYTASHFGDNFPFKIEPFIFDMARRLSSDYTGGFWNMYELTNGAFYMAPESDTTFNVTCMNGFAGPLSADAFGLTVTLYSYSNLSFSPELSDVCAEHYHLLREFLFEHPECQAILSAID